MMKSFRKTLRRLRRDDEGVTLVEYGIGVTLAVVVGTFMLTTLGSAITGNLQEAATCMTTNTCPAAVVAP